MASQVTAEQRDRLLAIGLSLVGLAVAAVLTAALSSGGTVGTLGDLEIYKGAISFGLEGNDLYSWVYQGQVTSRDYGFTYPPFAALALSWLVPLALPVAKAIWTLLTFVVLAAGINLLVRQIGPDSRVGTAPTLTRQVAWTAGLAVPVMFTYPFIHNFVVGQVTLFVIALALFDHQLPRRWQGSLIGLAAAIKLTPLVFVPYFLVTRQWRQAGVATGTFAVATGLAFVVLPKASITFWTEKLWQTSRVGATESTMNKSLLGTLTRLLPDGSLTTLSWLVVAALVTALALWQASKANRAGDLCGATLLVGALSVAVSPISWPHHQLWLVLVACWWFLQRGRLPQFLGLLMLAVFVAYGWFDEFTEMSLPLAIGVEVPALAVLLVFGFGSRPGARIRG